MECCGKDIKSNYCPDCGEKPKKKPIRKYLSEFLCDNPDYEQIVFINKEDVGKQRLLIEPNFRNYGYRILFLLKPANTEIIEYICAKPVINTMRCGIINKYEEKLEIIEKYVFSSKIIRPLIYPREPNLDKVTNIVFDGMKVLHYDPCYEDTLEKVIVGFVKNNITDPQCIHIIEHNTTSST